MNKDMFQGKWKQWSGRAKVFWGRVTRDRVMVFDGEQAELNGVIQERLGRMRLYRRSTNSWPSSK